MHHAMLTDAIASYQKAAGPDATGSFTQPVIPIFQMLCMHPHTFCMSFKQAGLQPGFKLTLVHIVQLSRTGIYTNFEAVLCIILWYVTWGLVHCQVMFVWPAQLLSELEVWLHSTKHHKLVQVACLQACFSAVRVCRG